MHLVEEGFAGREAAGPIVGMTAGPAGCHYSLPTLPFEANELTHSPWLAN